MGKKKKKKVVSFVLLQITKLTEYSSNRRKY